MSENEIRNTRRVFLKDTSYMALGLFSLNMILPAAASCQSNDTHTEKGMENEQKASKLGIALVGLGGYSEEQLAPALKETKYCRLAGIVTGTPSKAAKWKKKYDIPDQNVYNYQNFDSIKDNKEIDIVYVVLPNGMHAEYVIRAAKAGKHVICEKPMAVTVKECEDMIQACKEAGVMLSIGYRLHFEPFNLEMARLGQNKVFGNIKTMQATNGFVLPKGVWRADKKLAGGGPLMDLGVYCVQGVIYTIGELPIAITAKEGKKTDKEKFKTVEESISWTMEFANGAIAKCNTSYAEDLNILRAEAENGYFQLSPSYGYHGLQGETSKGKMNFPDVYEQALQMDDFAQCVIDKKPTKVPGEMGLRDVKILMAIYEAANAGKRVELQW
ncbi:MAG TPA: Gfo/Idh/MocA family oxidoreductase [Cytophagaceae bacterium]